MLENNMDSTGAGLLTLSIFCLGLGMISGIALVLALEKYVNDQVASEEKRKIYRTVMCPVYGHICTKVILPCGKVDHEGN